MLFKANALKGYALHSRDGEIGKVKEFYFDDRHWTVRYLVADTGNWLMDRQVLLSPHALIAVEEKDKRIAVDLTKKQIEDSPPLNSDKPVSRQFEEAYYVYYDWPVYWDGPYVWGSHPYLVRDRTRGKTYRPGAKAWDPNLRSTHDVGGYHIQAEDGEIGHVEDFIVDDKAWTIRYLIIDTRNWWPGKKVLVSSEWIERVSWQDSKLFVNLSRAAVKKSPPYTEDSLLTRDYETKLHRHYNRAGYWTEKPAARKHPK